MARIGTLTRTLGIIAGALALAGCQTMSGGMRSTSTMDADNNRLRSTLVVQAAPIAQPVRYRPIARCGYHQVATRVGGTPLESRFDLAIRAVRDRLLITMTEAGRASTALIGPDGTLFDFNLADEQGRRWTTENYSASGAGNLTQINQFTAIFPRFRQHLWNVGDRVAEIYAQDGKLWAEYVYRGLTVYQGRQAAVLDLVVTDANTEIQVAFNVIDIESTTPLLYVFDAGFKMRLQRAQCA